MTDLLRILAALILLYMQTLSRGQGGKPFPVVSAPTNTPTATRTPTKTFTPTSTPTATSTRQPSPGPSGTDPTGFEVVGVPPAQKLPSAVLIYPLVRASATQDTRIEMMNLTTAYVSVQCFYVQSQTCNEIGFFLSLTANQPISWKASSGMSGNGTRFAPPFSGDGELKCTVLPRSSDLTSYNALQGRALVSESQAGDDPPATIGYAAIAFRRLTAGDFNGLVSLDGETYEQCPDRLHFQVLPFQTGGPESEMVLVPCTQDLVNQLPSAANIQLAVINEFESSLSGATNVKCFNRIGFSKVAALRRSTVGTDTAHVIVRGTNVPVVGLVIDRFKVPGSGKTSVSSNEPNLEGGRSATVNLPQ